MVEKSNSKPGERWNSGNRASEQSNNRENMLDTVRKHCCCCHSDRLVFLHMYLRSSEAKQRKSNQLCFQVLFGVKHLLKTSTMV